MIIENIIWRQMREILNYFSSFFSKLETSNFLIRKIQSIQMHRDSIQYPPNWNNQSEYIPNSLRQSFDESNYPIADSDFYNSSTSNIQHPLSNYFPPNTANSQYNTFQPVEKKYSETDDKQGCDSKNDFNKWNNPNQIPASNLENAYDDKMLVNSKLFPFPTYYSPEPHNSSQFQVPNRKINNDENIGGENNKLPNAASTLSFFKMNDNFNNVLTPRSSFQSDLSDEYGDHSKNNDISPKHWGTGRKKIEIKFINNKLKRQITFSKRKSGLMKKVFTMIIMLN